MTPTEIAIVRHGFEKIAPNAEQVGLAFYDRLFAADPSLRAMFRGDIRAQVGHLMGALTMVVRSLDNLGPILDRIQALGARHAGYGVRAEHFQTVGAAFIATLQAGLGEEFTPEARAAWTRAYTSLAEAMIAAMHDALAKAA
jgi:hemoglobin-like flavoprotein